MVWDWDARKPIKKQGWYVSNDFWEALKQKWVDEGIPLRQFPKQILCSVFMSMISGAVPPCWQKTANPPSESSGMVEVWL